MRQGIQMKQKSSLMILPGPALRTNAQTGPSVHRRVGTHRRIEKKENASIGDAVLLEEAVLLDDHPPHLRNCVNYPHLVRLQRQVRHFETQRHTQKKGVVYIYIHNFYSPPPRFWHPPRVTAPLAFARGRHWLPNTSEFNCRTLN